MTRTGSQVQITYDGQDITSYAIYQSCSFEVQFSAIPGTFEVVLKDEARDLGPFITGKEITLSIDGTLMFGGFLTQVGRRFAFPVVRTDAAHGGIEEVHARQWVLTGVDYNILFDKRVLRYSTALTHAKFLTQLDHFHNDQMAGYLIRNRLADYIDASDIDLISEVEDVDYVIPWEHPNTKGAWVQQGTTWRKQMEDFSQFNGAVWYIRPDKVLVFKALESMQSVWGFSDVPNHRPIFDDSTFNGSTYGFRELEAVEDGSYITNDALIWGGSEWAGQHGGTLFARHENEASILAHGRWQTAETHFGEAGYGIQKGVTQRAELIVEGSPSQREEQLYGLKFPQWQFKMVWYGHDVPEWEPGDPATRCHLLPGQISTFWMYSFGPDTAHPLIQLLPLRQLRVSFPSLGSATSSSMGSSGSSSPIRGHSGAIFSRRRPRRLSFKLGPPRTPPRVPDRVQSEVSLRWSPLMDLARRSRSTSPLMM
jgi:hypothetical protein